jgi:hypothetical protein
LERARNLTGLAPATRVRLERADVFRLHFGRDIVWNERGPLLVVGNPPWVTSAELGALESDNLPLKNNIRRLKGIDALTGESNFDLAESIWLKLIRELSHESPTIAMLCKTTVARNVMRFAHQEGLPIHKAAMRRIDAKAWFGASVDACLLHLEIGGDNPRHELAVFDSLQSKESRSTMGFSSGKLIPDLAAYEAKTLAEGVCSFTWRQGVKHDAAAVMELLPASSGLVNGLGERVDVEAEYVYPLLKGRDVFHGPPPVPRLYVLATQRQLCEDTLKLRVVAPRLWNYLSTHQNAFERRKSSIYRNQPPFAMFGIGAYTFAAYKVAVSGFHKSARFRAVAPLGGKPVLLDDTCYFVACVSARQAALLAALLNDPYTLQFLDSIVFWDAKRPIKKSILQRMQLEEILRVVPREVLLARADRELNLLEGDENRELGRWPDLLETELFLQNSVDSSVILQQTFDDHW